MTTTPSCPRVAGADPGFRRGRQGRCSASASAPSSSPAATAPTNILGRPVEFGWHEVRPTEAGRADPVLAALGDGAPIFHWHIDTFTLPPGAVHLADERP